MKKHNVLMCMIVACVVVILSRQANADLIVHLTVPESSGSTTVNSGTAGGLGTLGGGVSFVADEPSVEAAPTGYSLAMDGTANSRVTFDPIPEFQQYNNRMVIAAWVKISDFSHYHHLIHVSSNSSGLPTGFVMAVRTDKRLEVSFRPASQNVMYANSGLATIEPGVWTHVAGKIDTVADTITLYINGEKRYTKSISGANMITGDSNTQFTLNRLPGVDASLFNGEIDDVRIYNNDMTDEEIANLVPEPATIGLIIIGILGYIRRR